MNLSPNLPPDKQREMLRQMLTIRRFEERASADYLAGKIYGVVHCYIGEEAVAVGVCSALDRTDRIISTHRGHGHCIAKGADLNRMMAELYDGRRAIARARAARCTSPISISACLVPMASWQVASRS
jgi:pyruvate dehydrogenase E1 component alpha subunit